jgi:hypothetical protein
MTDFLPTTPRLRLKYRFRLPYKHTRADYAGHSGKAHHNKLNQAAKDRLPPQPLKAMVYSNRKYRMVTIHD